MISPVMIAMCGETINEYKNAVVRTHVYGTLSDGGSCDINGTGFFIDVNGYIITAAHNVLPCSVGNLHGVWKTSPKIHVERLNSNSRVVLKAVLVYADKQTDLALLRVNTRGMNIRGLPLAHPHSLKSDDEVTAIVCDLSVEYPVVRKVSIDSPFNSKESYRGLIDISGKDIKPSSSGSPLLNQLLQVAGVITKGKNQTGEAAVPISYGAPLFLMAGVPYPSPEIREVIDTLRSDIFDWKVKYLTDDEELEVTCQRRLESGGFPHKVKVEFIPIYTENNKKIKALGLYRNIPVIKPRKRNPKEGRGTVLIKDRDINKHIKGNLHKPPLFPVKWRKITDEVMVKITAHFKGERKVELTKYLTDF